MRRRRNHIPGDGAIHGETRRAPRATSIEDALVSTAILCTGNTSARRSLQNSVASEAVRNSHDAWHNKEQKSRTTRLDTLWHFRARPSRRVPLRHRHHPSPGSARQISSPPCELDRFIWGRPVVTEPIKKDKKVLDKCIYVLYDESVLTYIIQIVEHGQDG
jgi:hypothetical protein